MQASQFNTNSQPFYVMLDHDGNALGEGVGYDPDASKFVAFLESGLDTFNR
jgi:thiol:disulfide interchange protein DsbD